MSVMSNQGFSRNGVKETGTNSGDGLSPAGIPQNSRLDPVTFYYCDRS